MKLALFMLILLISTADARIYSANLEEVNITFQSNHDYESSHPYVTRPMGSMYSTLREPYHIKTPEGSESIYNRSSSSFFRFADFDYCKRVCGEGKLCLCDDVFRVGIDVSLFYFQRPIMDHQKFLKSFMSWQ